jgi:hypothetical protein
MPLSDIQIATIEEFIASNEPTEQPPEIDMENAKRAFSNIQNDPPHTFYLIDYSRERSTMYHIYKAADNSVYICISHSTFTSYNDYLTGYYKM